MDGALPAPAEVMISAHAAEQYQARVKPGLDPEAARAELERLRDVGEVSIEAPEWLHAVREAPCYLLIGEALALPVLGQGQRWVASTCVVRQTLTPTRREAKSARKASLASRKRALRRARF